MTKIEDVKKDDYFKLTLNGCLYVRGEYVRSEKKYECYKYDDISAFRYFKKGKLVITDY